MGKGSFRNFTFSFCIAETCEISSSLKTKKCAHKYPCFLNDSPQIVSNKKCNTVAIKLLGDAVINIYKHVYRASRKSVSNSGYLYHIIPKFLITQLLTSIFALMQMVFSIPPFVIMRGENIHTLDTFNIILIKRLSQCN